MSVIVKNEQQQQKLEQMERISKAQPKPLSEKNQKLVAEFGLEGLFSSYWEGLRRDLAADARAVNVSVISASIAHSKEHEEHEHEKENENEVDGSEEVVFKVDAAEKAEQKGGCGCGERVVHFPLSSAEFGGLARQLALAKICADDQGPEILALEALKVSVSVRKEGDRIFFKIPLLGEYSLPLPEVIARLIPNGAQLALSAEVCTKIFVPTGARCSLYIMNTAEPIWSFVIGIC